MTFARLIRADWVAGLAALALLFTMAADWYSTPQGEEARRVQKLSQPRGATGGEVERRVNEEARLAAQGAEKNAWQASGLIDRVILAGLLATFLLAMFSAVQRARARRYAPPRTPSMLTALAATATALLVVYRIVQQPGLDAGTTVQAGAPLALIALGLIALACARALRAEESGAAFARIEAPAQPPPNGGAAGTPAPG